MKKSNKVLKIIKMVLIVSLLVAVISFVTTLLLNLNAPAIEVENIQLSQSEVIF